MVVGPQKNDAGYWTFWKVEGRAHNVNACLLPRGFAPEKNVQDGRNDWDRNDTSGVANLQPFSSAPLLEYA